MQASVRRRVGAVVEVALVCAEGQVYQGTREIDAGVLPSWLSPALWVSLLCQATTLLGLFERKPVEENIFFSVPLLKTPTMSIGLGKDFTRPWTPHTGAVMPRQDL